MDLIIRARTSLKTDDFNGETAISLYIQALEKLVSMPINSGSIKVQKKLIKQKIPN